jgi:hypothetical protein
MPYRERTWNANVLSDLLGTYLSQKSQEREKYYQAELKKKPTYQQFGRDLLKIAPDGSIETVMTKPTPASDLVPTVSTGGDIVFGEKVLGGQAGVLDEKKALETAKKTARKDITSIANEEYRKIRGYKTKTIKTVEGRQTITDPIWDTADEDQNVKYEPIEEFYRVARSHPERWIEKGRNPSYTIENFKEMVPESYEKFKKKYINKYETLFGFENIKPEPKPLFGRPNTQ